MRVDVSCAPGSICVIHVGAGEVLLALVAERKNAEGVDHWASSFGHATCFHRSIRAVPRTIAVAVIDQEVVCIDIRRTPGPSIFHRCAVIVNLAVVLERKDALSVNWLCPVDSEASVVETNHEWISLGWVSRRHGRIMHVHTNSALRLFLVHLHLDWPLALRRAAEFGQCCGQRLFALDQPSSTPAT